MSDEVFTAPDESREQWVDVRMNDPDEGEWDVDVVVLDGRVENVDLRISPDHLEGFLDCLVDDVDTGQAERILSAIAERKGLELGSQA